MMMKLSADVITDSVVLTQCKEALNRWSNKLPFTVSRNLGDAVEFVAANMYHAYSFSVDTAFAKREFDLQKGGNPVGSPVDIKRYGLWTVPGVKDSGDFDFPIEETCYKEICEYCGGEGKSTCDDCGGDGKVTCSKCSGSGKVKCSTCHGSGEKSCPKCASGGFDWRAGGAGHVYDQNLKRAVTCPTCHGSGKVTCTKCHSSGEVRCSKCSGVGEVKCGKCGGRGEIVCEECEGRGWNSFTWHLIQSEKEDALKVMFYDSGIAEKTEEKLCKKYTATAVFSEEKSAGQVDMSGIAADCSDFAAELHAKWSGTHGKFEGHDDLRVRKQKVELLQYDVLIKYEYKYKEKTYTIWIDLANRRVFEGTEGGLFAEWSAQVAKEGDKFAFKNPQMAIKNYAMACAISKDNKDPAKKLRKQLSVGSWLFRLATAGVGGCLWMIFFASQGVDANVGWYVAAAIIAVDMVFASKKLWLSFVAAAGVYGYVGYLFPELMPPDAAMRMQDVQRILPPEFADNVLLRDYVVCSLLLWVSGTLLFARDFALRIRGGIAVFPLLGVLVGAACAPTGYLDFTKDPAKFVWLYKIVTCIVCGLAVLRTLSRAYIQNCGRNAQKFPNFLVRFEAKTLNPNFWSIPVVAILFAGVGVIWYFFAGPGVSMEEMAQAAERFLQNEQRLERGKYYLELSANKGYGPSIARLAELKIFGGCGYEAQPVQGYDLAVRASDMDVAKGCWLKGYCLEFGKGVERNLTAANVSYTKGAELGDSKSAVAKRNTDRIARFWDLAHANDATAQYALALCYADGCGIGKNEKVARYWMIKSADAGFVDAQMLACQWLIDGFGGGRDTNRGLQYCEKAAAQNDLDAILALGFYYFHGKVVKRNYTKAIEYFNQACKKGSDRAAFMLGLCYCEGMGVEKNAINGFENYKLAQERGSLPGAYKCGECYEKGIGTSIDYSSALACYIKAQEKHWDALLIGMCDVDAKRAAERIGDIGKSWELANSGDAEAMDRVGLCFATGNGVMINEKEAYAWYVKSAENDCLDGIIHMADAYFNGKGVKQDKNAAGKAYERAAGKGSPYGIFMLGQCHEGGFGVERNLTSAYTCYVEAAKKKWDGADAAAKKIDVPSRYWDEAFKTKNKDAQYRLGCCFASGDCGVDEDQGQAFKLFKMASDQGNPDAQYVVALCYRDGIGTDKKTESFKSALFSAAKNGHVAAIATLGDMFRDGTEIKRDFSEALLFYKRAIAGGLVSANNSANQIDKIGSNWKLAHGGDAEAQYNLGVCYRDGVGVTVDDAVATMWFRKSAEQGFHDAEYGYAEMLFRERPTGREYEVAMVELLQKAVAANHIKAKTLLGKCLYSGRGIDENFMQAVALWEDAAANGDLEAKCELAEFHFTGRGVFNSGKDVRKAIEEWTVAADLKHLESSFRLGKYYARGSGLLSAGKDIQKAKRYLLLAANGGHRQAMGEIGRILGESSDVTDREEGRLWLERAAAPALGNTVSYHKTVNDTVYSVSRKVVFAIQSDIERKKKGNKNE